MEDQPGSGPPTCAVCPLPADKKCSACLTTHYCSVEHQKEDWKQHRKSKCTYLTLTETQALGKHFIASRNIVMGQVILQELPVTFYPTPVIQNHQPNARIPHCFTCCIPIDGKYLCSKCHWPVCSKACEETSIHADNECKILAKAAPYSTFGRPILSASFYKLVGIARAVALKENDPERWVQLNQLKDRMVDLNGAAAGAGTTAVDLDRYAIQSLLRTQGDKDRFGQLKDLLGFKNCGSMDQWIKISSIMDVNQFGMVRHEIGKSDDSYAGCVYLQGSRFTHSCYPNATREIGYSPHFQIQVRAARPIARGQVVTVMYYDECLFLGTINRQEATLAQSGFICACERCSDPTEFSSMSSALRCTSPKCPGYLLPSSFTPSDQPWNCSSCKMVKDHSYNHQLTGKLHKELNQLQEARNVEGVQNLHKKSKSVLHPNHWILQEATLFLYNVKYGIRLEIHSIRRAYTEEELDLAESYLRYLIKVRRMVSSPLSMEIAEYSGGLGLVLLERTARNLNAETTSESMDKLEVLLKERKLLVQTALLYWKHEIQNKPLDEPYPRIVGRLMTQEEDIADCFEKLGIE